MRGDHFLSFYMNARALFLGPDSKGLKEARRISVFAIRDYTGYSNILQCS